MGLLCIKITTPITKYVTEPIDNWVEQQEEKCKQYPWWDPRGWFCWFITVLVLVTNWVTKSFIVYVTNIVCTFITWFIGSLFSALIGSWCSKCNDWIKKWLLDCPKIEGLKENRSIKNPNEFDFVFKCNCNCFKSKTIEIRAKNEEEAFELAKEKCDKICQ